MLTFLYTSMFVYLMWKNKKGETLRALFQAEKAIKISKQMKDLGVDVHLDPEEIPIRIIQENQLN